MILFLNSSRTTGVDANAVKIAVKYKFWHFTWLGVPEAFPICTIVALTIVTEYSPDYLVKIHTWLLTKWYANGQYRKNL